MILLGFVSPTSLDFVRLFGFSRFAAATLKPRASVDHEGKAKTCVQTVLQDRKKYETERYRAEKKGTQYSKKERAERFKEPRSDRTVVEAASYEATKGAVEQAALLQDRKWSTLNGVTLAKAMPNVPGKENYEGSVQLQVRYL